VLNGFDFYSFRMHIKILCPNKSFILSSQKKKEEKYKYIFSYFWRPKVQNETQGVGRAYSWSIMVWD
jgi:hypothetical protein